LALKLKKLGYDRVRPLRGGYLLWAELGLPLQPVLKS
jgi:rhodanese-related sulfurtransferase